MAFSDSFFNKVQKKTNVDKDTILALAKKLQDGNMQDEDTLKEVIGDISKITGRIIGFLPVKSYTNGNKSAVI